MLLAPQHFQLLSTRYELLLGQALAGGALPGWGVRMREIDETRLLGGEFRLLEADVAMRDGLQVRVERSRPLDVDLTPLAARLRTDPCYVFLAVPSRRALETTGELARYRSAEAGPIRDESGESEITVPVLEPNLELWAGDSLPARLEGVPVARVRCREEAFVLDDYEPPTPALPFSSRLREECTAAVRLVREKALLVAGRFQSGDLAAGSADAWNARLQVSSLAAGLPALEGLLGLDRIHPQLLYLKMCDLAGQVAPVSHGLVPPVFVPYDHMDPAASVRSVLRFVHQTLEEGISDEWQRIVLAREGEDFVAKPDRCLNAVLAGVGQAGPSLLLGLRAPAGADAESMGRWCENAVIASASRRDELILARALGASREEVRRVAGLNPAAGMSLFAIGVPSEFLMADEPLTIEGSPGVSPRPAEAVLFVRSTPLRGARERR